MDNFPDLQRVHPTFMPVNLPTNDTLDLEQFKRLYTHFDQISDDDLMALYRQDVFFKDPIHELTGQAALIDYFAAFRRPGVSCRFEFINQVESNGQAFFHWKMHYKHPALNQGATLMLEGATLIKSTAQVFFHQDFYDMGAMIYQHVPVLGWAVNKLNTRIAGKA